MDAASTAAAPTSAMPIVSAPAVFAARRGLRTTLPRASRPTGRHQATAGAASTRTTAGTTTGPTVSTPTITPAAPRPSSRSALSAVGRTAATTAAAAPAAISTLPSSARRRSDRSFTVTSSRIASTGGTSDARRAGRAAAAMDTRVPTASPMSTVDVESGMVLDNVICNRSSTAPTSVTRPSPPSTPSTEPSTPITAACTTIEENTCAGEAPTARSSANSRIRWRICMVNVLAMMNAPTNRASTANTSRNVETKPSCSAIALFDSSRIA